MNGSGSVLSVNKEKDARQIIITLTIILVAQIVLSCFLKYSASQNQPVEMTAKLITADLKGVTKIEITNGTAAPNEKPFIVQKEKDGWIVPSYYHAPVAARTVSKFYDMLKSLPKGLPIATTADAAKHFFAGSDNFRQKLTLYSDKATIVTLYMGNPSSLHNTYVRLDGSDNVYNLPITSQAINASPQVWFDKNMTSLEAKQVEGVEFGSFKLKQDKDGWLLIDKDGEHPVGNRAIADPLDKVTHIDCHSILSDTKLPEFDADNPVFDYSLTLKDGKHIDFSFSKATGKPWHVLKMSNMNLYFEVDPWGMKEIQAITPDSILKQQAEADKKH